MMSLYVYVFIVAASCIKCSDCHTKVVGGTVKNDKEMLLLPRQASDKKQNMLEFPIYDEVHLWSSQLYIFA